MTGDLPQDVVSWALRRSGGRVVRHTAADLGGGAVAERVVLITISVETASGEVDRRVVRKWGFPFEVTALRAAQAVRETAPAVPELIADGVDDHGTWLVLPYYDSHRPPGEVSDAGLFESLAELHVRYRGGNAALAGIPTVTAEWWFGLCRDHVLPAIAARRAREAHPILDRAEAVIRDVAEHKAVGRVLTRLAATLIHNDVHSGNLIESREGCVLIDWGSARVGPAMLDLANIASQHSVGLTRYQARWRQTCGEALAPDEIEGGFRWARLQIPVQYLPWVAATQPIKTVAASVEKIEQAVSDVAAW